MLVGDLQRVVAVPTFSLAVEQHVPPASSMHIGADPGYRGRMMPKPAVGRVPSVSRTWLAVCQPLPW